MSDWLLPCGHASDLLPAAKVRVVKLGTGTHCYEKPEDGLPMGLVPSVARIWHEAIMGGYYVAN